MYEPKDRSTPLVTFTPRCAHDDNVPLLEWLSAEGS